MKERRASMNRVFCSALFVVAAFGVASQAPAQDKDKKAVTPSSASAAPAEQPGPEIIRLSVPPAAEPRPALKYSLLPRMEDRKPGNAVPYYYRAILEFTTHEKMVNRPGKKMSFSSQLDEWSHAPLDTFPKQDVHKRLDNLHSIFDNARTAAYREECEWDWRLQDLDGIKQIAFILEEMHQARGVARFLA